MDVSVVGGAALQGTTAHWSLAWREQQKQRRFPGNGLYPVVVDTRGRWGREANAWILLMIRCFVVSCIGFQGGADRCGADFELLLRDCAGSRAAFCCWVIYAATC